MLTRKHLFFKDVNATHYSEKKIEKNKHILVHKTWAQECKSNLEKEYCNSEYCNSNTEGYLVSWYEVYV